MKTALITTYYNDRVKERDEELITSIKNNIQNKAIDLVIILIEKGTILPELNKSKVVFEYVYERPKFEDFVAAANKYKYGVSIIANTDIYFDEYNIGLIKSSITKDECYALSRWDMQTTGDAVHYAHRDSQDVWIFKGPIKEFKADFLLGKAGIDNRIAYEISEAGYEVTNPSKTIKSFHLHISGVRNYTRMPGEVIPPPYFLIPPTYLGEKLITEMMVNKNGQEIKSRREYEKPKLTEFDRNKQITQINKLLSSNTISKRKLLSIVILSTHDRAKQLANLKDELFRQMAKHRLMAEVEIHEVIDNGYAPIGWKRNKGNIDCHGQYVAHFDSDDKPSEDYVIELVSAIRDNYGKDVITFNALVTYDDTNPELMKFHRKNKTNHRFVPEAGKGGDRYWDRMPCHLNAIKREKALENTYYVYFKEGAKNRKEREDYGSDVHYSMDMVKFGTLQSDAHIDKVLYYYKYKQNK